MKFLAAATVFAALAVAAPAQAQVLGGNSGLLGVANNLVTVQTGHISVLNGGILNGTNVLSGIGLGSTARTAHSATTVTGSGHTTAPGGTAIRGNGNTVVPGNNNTVVPGSNNVVGTGNVVGNQWGSNSYSYSRSFTRLGW